MAFKTNKLQSLKGKSHVSILDGTKAYIELRQNVTKHGILEREYTFYSIISFITFFCIFLSVYEIYITPISFALVGWCLLLAFFTVQAGGLVHDAGHRAIAKTTKINDILGNIFGSLIVMQYNAWSVNHNKHHAHTNQEDEDPDMDLPLHGFTQRQFANQKGLLRLLNKYQAYLFYPLRSLAVYTQRTQGLYYLLDKKKEPGIVIESIIWVLGVFIWFALPFFIFPLTKALVVFFLVHTLTGFYLSNIFAPNHKGMPQLPKNVKISFLEHQIMTSRNIYGHWLTDYVFMGLNYQIEHHLFPNCPRNKLKYITPFVLDICRKMNLEFTEVSILESNKIILAQLNQIASSN